MTIKAKVLADSVSPDDVRITTLEVVMPRIVLAEFNTHRVFSRNSASSRAIPVSLTVSRVMEDPFVPLYWGKNQKGMKADTELSHEEQENARWVWLQARDSAVEYAKILIEIGVHKQIANRLLEPFMWHTVICTSTEWSNFFNLRDNKEAQPEIMLTAQAMKSAINASEPRLMLANEWWWHLPLVLEEEIDDGGISINDLVKISAARCARVSYLTHDGRKDITEDLKLYDRLLKGGHMSPLEHPATPGEQWKFYGNLRGWKSLRWHIPGEIDILEFRKTLQKIGE